MISYEKQPARGAAVNSGDDQYTSFLLFHFAHSIFIYSRLFFLLLLSYEYHTKKLTGLSAFICGFMLEPEHQNLWRSHQTHVDILGTQTVGYV